MLLLEITINSVLHRVSNESLNLEHHWYPYIESFDSPQMQIEKDYGGFARLGFGSVTLSPALFASDWPPPAQCDVTAKYTASNEAAAVTLFTSAAHLQSYSSDKVAYDIWDIEYDSDVLDEAEDYNGDTVPLPRTFGSVTHRTPTRLPDVDIGGGYGYAPTYHLSGIVSSLTALRIIAFTYYSAGVTKVTIGDASGNPLAHGFSNGETVYISGSDNFNGGHTISNASGSVFTIPVAFALESLPLYCHVFKAGSVQVFDDGYPIPENFFDNGDGTFSLTAAPVGEVTISGTAAETTLAEVMDWGRARLGLSSLDTTYAASPSPAIGAWITGQEATISFLSRIAAAFKHLFYIKNNVMYLVDMSTDNGSTVLTEFNFFEGVEYERLPVIKSLKATWQTREAAIGTASDNEATPYRYIKTVDHEKVIPMNEKGTDEQIDAFNEDEASVLAMLEDIQTILERDYASIKIPFSATLPDPGKKLSWTDSSLPGGGHSSGYIRARILEFNFDNAEVIVSGDGEFS